MKFAFLIIGIVVLGLGCWLLGSTWYDAAFLGHFSEASAYAGPVLIILGLLRMARAASAVPLPQVFRLGVVGLAIATGYGNSALLKLAFPNAIHDRQQASNP
jgi:hypothetical protein